MTQTFKDHFSGHAADYTRYRPTYPNALFHQLARLVPQNRLAWDCATGGGQAALLLAEHFTSVIATDASSQQIAEASAHPRVSYARAPAERTELAAGSVDLVSVAQAAHWFEINAFYDEVRRVAAPGCVLAIYGYGLLSISPEVDALILALYKELDPWWPPERLIVDGEYRDLPFPFPALEVPRYVMESAWSLQQVLGYLGTWSAVRRCMKDRGSDPLAQLAMTLPEVWPAAGGAAFKVSWSIFCRAGRVRDF